ncbi:unnamed protein product [Fusarium graminearum]|uniref:Chromosome 2, complete genome n=1 Tax=Gibberella zeae (strain ATCC MYA-4620 / CBS 123657 / FGSC 9075 / NRRL 31084 / PH-1) TaxID=229533 RepID=A0A1C3YNC4_GIBZE|nr:unnamed protein product [Fusarium graminearum]
MIEIAVAEREREGVFFIQRPQVTSVFNLAQPPKYEVTKREKTLATDMVQVLIERSAASGASRPRQRAYHTKSRTGCRTCKIRKVRCDEQQPACDRCTSTARVCDGYAPHKPSSSISQSPSPQRHNSPNPTVDLKLVLPRQSPEEVRSYSYFLEVTAHLSPALSTPTFGLPSFCVFACPIRLSGTLLPEHVEQANGAAQSLLTGLVLFSQQHAKQLGDLQTGKSGLDVLSILAARQEVYTRFFNEITKAIHMFQQEIDQHPRCSYQLEADSILPLRLFHDTNRLLLIQDPDEPDLEKRQRSLPLLLTSIVDLAEQIMNVDPQKTRRVSYTHQLFLVTHNGTEQSTRKRAVTLLRRPRFEGAWDSLISASLADAIMDREREAAWEYHVQQGLVAKTFEQGQEETDPMFRIFNFTFAFTGSREARVVMWTWQEKLNDLAGQERVVQW